MTGKRTFGIAIAALLLGLLGTSAALAGGQAKEKAKAKAAHYQFRGHLKTVSSTSLSLTVEGGNRLALKKMLGASVDQSFAVGDRTEFLKWAHGIPTVVHAGDLVAGDWVVVNVRAPRAAELAEIEAQSAQASSRIAARQPNPPTKPLFLFRGKLAAAAGSSSIAIDVGGGNHRALRLLLGQNASQTFAFGSETIFLLWQGKVPTVISAADLTGRRPRHRPHPRRPRLDARPGRVDAGRARRRPRAAALQAQQLVAATDRRVQAASPRPARVLRSPYTVGARRSRFRSTIRA